jgi:hypothetical protein
MQVSFWNDKNQFLFISMSVILASAESNFTSSKNLKMETTFNPSIAATYEIKANKSNTASRFISWCNQQEEYRFGWLGGILAVHGCALTPITLFAIILSGVNIALFITALVAMGMALVTNLAAMPTKIVIPVFFLSVLMDVAIIAICAINGFTY